MRARRYVAIAGLLAVAAAAIDASVTYGGAPGGSGEPPAAQGITGHDGPDVAADLGHPYAAYGVGGLLRAAQAQGAPEVSEESVAVTGNGTSTNSTMPVQPADTTKPSLAGAAYHTDGTLTLSFSEALDQTGHDAGLIHVRDAGQTAGGVTLSNDMVTSHAGDSITFGLGDDHAAAVNLMSAPQLDMDAGAVRDEAGNPSDALADYSISVTGESTPNVGQANAGQNATQNTGQNSTQTGQANAGQNATQNTGQNSTQTGQANAGQNATQIPTNMTGASAEPESSAWSIRADYTPGDDYTDGNVRVSIELPNYDDCGEPNVTASKLSLKASKGSTVTVGSDKITTSWNEFEINVTSKENTLRLQTPPRTVEVQTGGITCPQKSASNTAKLTAALSNSNDNEAPTIDSAVYGVSGNNKYVTVTFNEDVISVIKAKMYLVNSTDAEMSLASNTVTHSSHTNRSKITLTSAQVSWFDLSDPPYVRITANGTTDVWGNMNSENVTSDNPIKIPDALSAAIDSASYSPWDKTVSVSTSINLNAVDHTKIKVKAGSSTVSFANATDPDGSSSFTLGLTNAQNTKLEKQTPPRQIEIGVGGITDDTGTKNPAKITSVLSNQDDQSHPQIQSAVYGVSGSTSFVTVTFDEDTIPVDHAKVYIVNSTGTEISFASNKISHTTHTNSSKITLTAAQKNWFDLSNPPDVRITPNGITDVWGNTNSDQNVTSIITVPNALRAAINSATYNPTEKTISVSTSLTLNAVDSSKIKLKAKSGSTISVTNVSSPSGSDFTIRLTDAQNKNLAKQTPPRTVEIGIGGITDDTNTKNVAAMTGVLSNSDDSTYPSINSATYGISGSTASVTVTFDEDTLPVDHAKVYIVNSTGGEISFASNKISHTTHTNSSKITLTTAQKNWFDLSDPPEVRITPNGITDVWGNTNSDQNVTQTITVPDALVTTISSAQYSPSSKDLTVDLSHQVHQIDGSKIKLKAKSGSTISVSSSQLDTTQDTSYFTINLTSHASTFEAQTPPRTIEIQKNGITDDYGAKNVDAITTTISYSDSSAPSISAANYTGGTIKATFDEKVLSLNKSKVSITAKSGAAILVSGQTSHTARSDHLTITLTNAQKASYAAQTPPRYLTVQQNGMSDIWGNQNDNSVSQTITYLDDTAPPTINSATYDIASRTLNVTLSEKVVALDHNSISVTASKGNPVTPTSSQLNHATHTDNFTVTLDAAGGAKVISQTHPRQVSIAASKLTDVWGNSNSAALSYAISYTGDTSAPSISSATYNTAAGTMAVTISEASLPVVQSKVRLTDSSANMSVSTISHTSHATSFTITLSNAEKASFRAQTPPRQVQVLAGGLTDVWNNANQNALTRTASYTGDTTAPGILSATYNTDTRDLLVILNEDIVSAKHDKMKLKGSGSGEITDIQSNQITLASHSDRFTIRLTTQQNTTFTGLAEPRTIVIDAGGVADVWSNANSAQLTSPSIRNDNNDPLAVNEAEYGVDTGVLDVTMSKSLKSYDSAKIKVGDASSNMTFQAGAFTRVSSDEITTTLAGNAKTTFENLNHPRKVFVLAGGATDLWDVNNPNDIEAAISYDDETAPSLNSASYATASGRLTVALSEHLASHDSTKLVLYDSTKAGNATLTSNAMTQNPSGTISTTLSGATKGAFENMTHPRHIAILTGGVTDRWNNHNAAELTAAISDDDNTAPALSSASYSKSTGDITIKLSERAASYNAAKFALHDSSKTGNVTLTSNTMTQNPFGTLTARLSDTQRESFADLNYPRHLAISSGGVTDIWNNANSAQLSTAVSYGDPNNMTITSAEYDVNSGLLNVTVSEDIFRHDSAKIILKDSSSSVTFGSGDFAESKPGFLTITLDGAKKASFEGLSHPRNVTIQAGGVADIWNRTNDEALTRHIQYEGTVAPSISSAEYGTATGLLNATFPESLARYDHSRIILNDSSANVTIASGSLSQHTSGVLTVKLSGSVLGQFENLTHPRSITVLAGGVSDIWNRTNEAALARSVSYDDAAAPALNSVSYSTVRGEMTITLSERAASHDSTKFVLYDSTKTGNVTLSGTLAQNTHGTLTATLTTAQKTSLASLSNPRHLAILPGGVTDIWNNANAAHLSAAISYGDPNNMAITSAEYGVGTGILNVTMSEDVLRYDHAKITLKDSSSSIAFGSGDLAENTAGVITITLNSTKKASFEGLSHPRSVAIQAGGVADIWNRTNANALTLPVSHDETTPPTLSSAKYNSSTGALTLTLSEKLVLPDNSNVILYDASKSGNLTVSLSGASQDPPGVLTVTLAGSTKSSFEDSLSHPRHMAIPPGNIIDIWNNANAAALVSAVLPASPAPLGLDSAVYEPSSGSLKLKFSENLASYSATGIALYNPAGTANITFGSSDIAETVPGTLNATLNSQQKTTFKNWLFPRNVTVSAGAVTDIWNGTTSAKIRSTISYPGVASPAVSYAKFIADNGTLVVGFSAPLDTTTHNMASVIVRATDAPGQPSETYPLNNAMIIDNGTNYVKLDLSGNSRIYEFAASLDPLNIVFSQGAVRGIWDNQLQYVWYWQTNTTDTLPALESVTYIRGNGTLYLQFSEHMAASTLQKQMMTLVQAHGGGRGYSLQSTPATVSGSLVTFAISKTGQDTVNTYYPPEINILSGAIKDVSGNSLKAYSGYSVSTPDRNLPKLTSAHYLHQNGIISLGFDQFLKSVDESKIVLHDSSGKGNVTLGDGAFPIEGNYQKVISATMEQSQITAFEDLGYPRNVTIQKGGITDIWDNGMEHTTRIISSSDNQPPGLRSAAYATATGALNLTLSEDLLSHDSAKIVLHDSTKSGNVTFAANSFTEIADGVLSINLTGSAKANFAALNHPRNATILSGGATDIWNNSNAADLMAAISDDDDTAPALSSATYAVSTGTLNLTISEDLASHDSTKITLYDSTKSGNVTFAANSFTEIADGVLSINLTGSVKVNFLKLNHPRNATILSGAVTDLWNNSNAADLKSAISDDDAAAPTISSAEYTVSTGALNLTLSEDLASHDSTKVILYDSTKSGNITLAANSLAESSAGSLTMTLNATAKAGFKDLNHPRNIAILSGGVTDLWGNSNAANLTSAISDDDDTAPTISSVEYTVSTGMLNLTLSEDLAAHDSTKITLYDSTKSGNVTFSANQFAESSAGSLTITLSGTPKSNFESLNHPRNAAVLVGGVTDLWGNSNAANLTSAISDDDDTAPTISSAEYEISTNVLNLTLSEDLAAHDSTKVVLYDSTKSGNITLAANSLAESSAGILTMTLNSSAKASFAALNHPRNVTVLVGGVTDLWGNSNAAPLMKVISHADAPAPTISSVEYETAANMLNVTISEDLAVHDSTKIILYDSTKSGNVTFSANAFTESSAGSLTITLSGSTKTGFEDLSHPRNITILSGGVTNIWGNSNAADLMAAISDDDAAAPTMSSAEYTVSTGMLNLTLSEDLASHDSTKVILYDSTKSGNITLAANSLAESSAGSLTMTLNATAKAGFEDLSHPRNIAILSGGVTDLWGNSNAANLTSAISDDDDTPPTISSAKYATATGMLNLTLSEDLAAHDSTKITLYDSTKSGNVTFSANQFTESSAGSLTITLGNTAKANFEALNHPRNVTVLVGGVTDLWGNSNAANLTSAISDDDDTAPTISSAEYEISTGALNLTLSEDLAAYDATKITLYDSTKSGNVTFSANQFTEVATGILSITLTGNTKTNFEDLNHPRNVTVLVGGVTDIWGNSNTANLTRIFSYVDAPTPTISSAKYATATGILNLTLSEDLAAHDSTKITLYDSTKSGNVTFSANQFTESSAGSLTITLSGTPKSNFESLNHPRNAAILAGGVTNIWGNSNAANLTSAISDDDDTAPTISSAKYATATGMLNLTLSEDLAAHDSTKITLYDSTKSGNVTFAANAFTEVATGILSITLTGNTKTNFEDLNHPRNVTALVGGVTDIWGNSNTADLKSKISDDDDTPPTISSAKYATATGMLNLTLSEDLAAHDSTKITLYDSTKSGNVTFSANQFTESSAGSLTITLSGTPKSNFESLNHPRNVTVLVGGVTDIWGNSNTADLKSKISDDDDTPPTISSAKYATATGMLNLTLSEDLAAHDSTKITLYDSTKSGNVTFSANAFTESSAGSLTITLSNTAKANFESLNHPRNVAVLVGGVTDIWGNSNAANLTRIFSYVDAPTPTISSAKYATATGMLNLTLSEDLAAHDSTKIILYDSTKSGNVTFAANAFTESSAGSLTITLSNTAKANFESLNHPRNAAILAGGVTNIWGNSNAANLTSAISDDDDTPPTISSAKYATATGILNLTLSEDLAAHDSTKIILYDSTKSGNVTFAANAFTEVATGILSITLTGNTKTNFEDLNHPRNVTALVGGVTDIWGNSNAANLTSAISDDDDTPPTISSAEYATATGILNLTLSEDLAAHDSTKITLYDSTKSGNVTFSANQFAESSAGSLTITLSGTPKSNFEALSHPRNAAILVGGVTDIWGNSNAANLTSAISDDDDTPPTISSAEYEISAGALNLTLSEDLAAHDSTKITLYDSTKSGNVTFSANAFTESSAGSLTITLSGTPKSNFESLNHPRNAAILVGGVTDIWGNSNAANLTRIFSYVDAPTPTISSAEYATATGILNLTLSEDLAAHDSTKITLYDSTKSGNVTFAANAFTESSAGSLTITLSNTAKANFEALNHPRNVTVLVGGVTNTWGNSNTADLKSEISDDDDTPPTISSAEYATATGILNLTLSEDLAAHDSTKITLYDSTQSGNVTFSANAFAESSAGSLTITLSNTAKANFEALNHPRNVTVLVGGVTDIWGNSNTANLTSAISDDDDAAPTISSVAYAITTDVLALVLSEDIASHDSTKIVLYDSTKSGNVTFPANAFTESSAGILSITLSGDKKTGFEALNHPRNVAILTGGVTDIWDNSNAANLTSAISDDDDTPPTISSAEYATAAGMLNLTLSEDLAAHDSTKITLYDSTKSGNVTFSANAFTEVADGILGITLSGNTKSSFEALNHPRNVTILAGGVTDIWNNPNAAPLTAEFSYDDAAAPTISSAKYATATGILNLTLSEDLAAHDSTKIILYDSTKSGNVTFSANQFAESSAGSLTITLSNAAKANFEALNHPRNVAVLAGGVTDLWGNSNAANLTSAISDDDDTPPAISTVAYAVASGALNLTLSEDLAAHDSTKITLYDSTKSGNVTFSANQFAESSAGSLTITLSNAAKANFEALNHPRNVAVLAGGVTDLWGNSNAANLTSAISDDDDTAPSISSAGYVVTSGLLNVALSEDLAAHDSTKIILYDSTKSGNVTFTANSFAEPSPGILSITLSGNTKTNFEALNHPRNVAILVGGVTDLWGNANAANLTSAISGDDDTPPAISSAEYAVSTGTLNVTISEDVAEYDSTKVVLYDSTKSGNVTLAANSLTEVSSGVLTATLNDSAKAQFESLNHPRNVTILAGGVTDIWNNPNAAPLTAEFSYDDAAAPTISSVEYATATGILNLTLSEDLAAHDSTKIILYDSTKSGNVTFSANQFAESSAGSLTITLSNAAKANFEALNHPRNVAVLAGGVTDLWGNSNAANLTSAISDDDDTPPAISTVAYAVASGALNLTLSEDLAAHDSTKITLYDSTKSGNVTFSANQFAESSAGSLTITLSNTAKANFEALNHPRNVAVLAGGVTDLWGNSNAANLTSAISDDDNAAPTISFATYVNTTGALNLTLSEDLAAHDSTKITLYDSTKSGNVTFAANQFAEADDGVLSITLSGSAKTNFEALNHPRNAAVLAGGVTDLWGNSNAAELTSAISGDDSTPPTISSAEYAVASGALSITLSEDLAGHDSTKITLYDSTKSGNVTFAANQFAESSRGVLTATLSGSAKAGFEDLNHPRNAAVLAGGVTDIWGNSNNASLASAISYDDSTPPTISSAEYAVASGALNVTLSEDLAAHDSSKVTLYDSTKSGNVTFAANQFATADDRTLSVTLGGNARTQFIALDHPRNISILSGGVTDIWGNSNTASVESAISYDDAAPPAMSSATYDKTSGLFRMTFTEDLASHDSTKIVLYDQTKSGNVTFSANQFAESSRGVLTKTLNDTEKAGLEALGTPKNAAVLVGGVTDIWGNSNASPLASTISGDIVPPRLTAATYYTGNSTILLEFDERLGRHDSTKILLSDSGATNVTFAAGRFSGSGHTIAATLTGDESRTFDGMNNPNAEVLPGGATDSWDNANTVSLTARVTILDTTPPTFHSATYKTSGTIAVKFSEPLKSVAAGGFSISTGTHNASFPKSSLSGDTVTATLDAADAYLFDAPGVTLRIAAGAVTDMAGNPAAANSTTNVTVVDDAPPVFVNGTYHTNGTLALSFNEMITSVAPTYITLQHGSSELTLVRVTYTPGSTVSFILDKSDHALFDDASYVVLNMKGGAVTDSAGRSNAAATGRHLAVHDNAAPYVTGATYYAATGILSLKMNEPVASVQTSMMTMNDTGSPVTLSGGADIAGDALSVALSEQNRTRFASSPSLSISMSEGAITDQARNDILEVSYYDVAVPSQTMTLVGGAYSNDDGIVSMVFSENVTGISLEQITMQAGSNQYTLRGGSISGTQTFGSTSAGPASLPASNGRAANSPAYGNTVDVTIPSDTKAKFAHEDDITISISGNAVNGTSGGIGVVSAPLFVSDSVKPSFVSAAYQPDDGVLAMKFSEIVGSADPGGLTLKAGSITVNPSYLPAKLGDTVRVQMSGADKASLADASSITLGMAAGAVKDVSGNPIDAASGLKVDISRDAGPDPAPALPPPIVPPPILFLPPPLPPPPSAPPTLAVTFDAAPAPISASYDVAYKLLAVTFTEAITYEGAETGGFNLTSSGAPLELERPAQSGPRTMTALVKGAPEPHNMTLYLDADAVKDGSGNGNRPSEVAVHAYSSARPAPSHAAYNLTSGHIVVHFDNEITDVDPALFRMGNGSLLDVTSGETLLERAAYFAIDERHRDDVESYRTLDVEAGAATGPDGASSPPAYGVRMYGPPVAGDVDSVVYDAASDTLWLDIEGYGVAVDGSAVTLDGVSLSEMRVMLNGVPAYEGNSTVFPVGEAYMNVSENAITTRYGAIPAGGYAVDVFEGVSVRGVSEAAAGNSTMVQIVRNPSSGAVHAALAYSHNVSLVDITDPAEPAVRGVISADGPVLDMDSVELPGAAYLAVLTNKSVTLYDAAAPAVAGRLSHAFNVSQGTISHVTLDGLGHLVVVSQDTATSILVAEPSSPTVLSRASLGGAAAARIDSVGVANGVAAASMLSGELCLLDVNATSGLAAECVGYGGGDHAALAYVMAQEGPRIMSAGNASAISVHDIYLNVTATRGTDAAASDIGAALIYGKAYAVALVSGEVVVYDAAGGLARVSSAFTPHTTLDVAEFAGSVYAVLAGQNMTVVELAGTARHADP